VKKLTFFLKKDVKCKMFLKKRMRVPLLKAPWDSFPGIGYIGGKIIFIKKKLTLVFPHLFFILNIRKH
jgi:hypothetical protein